MSLFACRKCGCVENTACCNYWSRKIESKPLLCSECDPDIAAWHGRFDKRPADGMLVDQDGNLWGRAMTIPAHSQIMGAVAFKEG